MSYSFTCHIYIYIYIRRWIGRAPGWCVAYLQLICIHIFRSQTWLLKWMPDNEEHMSPINSGTAGAVCWIVLLDVDVVDDDVFFFCVPKTLRQCRLHLLSIKIRRQKMWTIARTMASSHTHKFQMSQQHAAWIRNEPEHVKWLMKSYWCFSFKTCHINFGSCARALR